MSERHERTAKFKGDYYEELEGEEPDEALHIRLVNLREQANQFGFPDLFQAILAEAQVSRP